MWFCCSAIGDEDRSSIVGYGRAGVELLLKKLFSGRG
jgi:hypothetical protein